MSKSLIEIAHEFVAKQKSPIKFKKIWAYVKKEGKLSQEDAQKIAGQFYTNLLLDGRFVTLGDNEWDLRANHTFDKVHIDMKDVYSDVETTDEDNEDNEDSEYNKVFEDKDPNQNEEINEEETEENREETEEIRGF